MGMFSEGLAAVQIDNKFGYINTSGTIVINPQFDQTTMFSGGLAVVTVSGNSGVINREGKYVVNPGQYKISPPLREGNLEQISSSDGIGLISRDGKSVVKPSKALTSIAGIFGKVFWGAIGNQSGPISLSGRVLAGPYKGATLDSLAEDIQDESNALASIRTLVTAEASYSGAYPATGFTASISALGPYAATPDENHAGFIDPDLAKGTKDGYQFAISIPTGTSTGGTNFNYLLVAKPAAGHAGLSFCADSSGAVHYAAQGEECTITSPTL
jgi:hypothetical protein